MNNAEGEDDQLYTGWQCDEMYREGLCDQLNVK